MNNQEEMKKDELNAAPETAEAAGETEEKTASPQEKTAEPAAEEAPEQPEEKKEDKKDEKKKGFFSPTASVICSLASNVRASLRNVSVP